MVLILEEAWDSTLEEPQGPAVAKINQRYRNHPERENLPRYADRRLLVAEFGKLGEFLFSNVCTLTRIVSEIKSPDQSPEQACNAHDDERSAPGNGDDQCGHKPW